MEKVWTNGVALQHKRFQSVKDLYAISPKIKILNNQYLQFFIKKKNGK